MRILHLTDHYAPVMGGIEVHVAGLAHRQALEGHRVTVLTSTPRTAEGVTSADTGPVKVVRVHSVAEALRAEVGHVDLVHAHVSVVAPFTAPVVAVLARRGVPTVVTVHSLWSGMGPVPGLAAALTGLRSAPVTWSSVSNVAAEDLRGRLPFGTPVHVLNNAVEAPPRSASSGNPGGVRLVSTMRIARRKRPLDLLRILGDVTLASSVPVDLTIIGDGPLRGRFERRARRLGLEDQVRVTGRVSPARVLGHLARSDVYVAPAVLESFGLAALEARGVGLPVVGRLGTGLADFIEHGVDGLLCADDVELAEALVRLAEDASLRRRISEHNRSVAHEMTWARALSTHERVYAAATGARLEAAVEP